MEELLENEEVGDPADADGTEPAALNVPDDGPLGGELPEEEVPGLAEACRRFPMPDAPFAEHALRELGWGEHLVVTRMVPSKGGTDLYLYSLKSAAIFLLDNDAANASIRSGGAIKLMDIDAFVEWVRTAVGDTYLADAMQEGFEEGDSYNERLQAIQFLIGMRMTQYEALEV